MADPATTIHPHAADRGARPHCVLVVESSRAMAGIVAASLDAVDGIVCEVADSLAAAEARIATDPARFVVAVVGLSLPDAPNGEIVDVLHRAGLRVIVLTGHVDPSWRRRMFERGVADYVVKDSAAGVDYVVRAVARMYRNLDTQVLVVDDAQAFRDYAASLLAQHGYRTLTARDGHEGLATLAANPRVRVVVTDYLMPRLDGIGMVQEMRKLRSVDDLAIVAISESTEEGVLARFLKSGANDFLRKPFSVEEFYCRIDQNIDMLRAVLDARRLAERDFLTGLYNRRYFFERAARLHAQAVRGATHIVMAMIDIDHFKRINDDHGHHGGDRALVAVAERLVELSADDGIVARFGGEEFVCVGVVDAATAPAAYLERLRAGIAAIALDVDGGTLALTASIGATLTPGPDLDDMLARADAAAYAAKAQGRNRVVLR